MTTRFIVWGFMIFGIGFLLGQITIQQPEQSSITGNIIAQPPSAQDQLLEQFSLIEQILSSQDNQERPSPHNWIPMDDITVLNDHVRIRIDNPEWALFTNTNSMDPVIDATANAIEIIPQNESDIHIGDIVAYKSDYHDGLITHRVIKIDQDSKGWYATLKGDNNPREDPGRIRFDQIKRVVVAIIY